METKLNKYDIVCLALKSAPRYTKDGDDDLLTSNLCDRYGIKGDEILTVRRIVTLALDAATSGDFRGKAEFLMSQVSKYEKEYPVTRW